MVFNLQKFLIENKLTKRSRLQEDAETTTDSEQLAMNDEEMFGDQEQDPYYKDDSEDTGDFEKEPTPTDTGKDDSSLEDLQKKQVELEKLEDQKNKLVKKLNNGEIKIDQYKAAIGDIPTKIKKLRADIKSATTPSVEDGEEENLM